MAPLLRPYFVFLAASNAMFFQAVFFLFYEKHAGLGVPTVLWLQSWAVLVRSVFDLPFGVLADRRSRRACLVGCAVAQLTGVAAVLAHPALWTVLLAETAFGVGSALRSGADSALLFDGFRAAGREVEYPAAESRAQAVAAIASGAAGVVGGVLGAIDLRLPYALSLAAALIAVGAAAQLTEPPHGARGHIGWSRLPGAARTALRSAPLRWSIALAAYAVTLSHVYFYLQQPFLIAVGAPTATFGILFAGTKVVTAIVAAIAHRVDDAIGERGVAAVMTAAPTVGLGAMAAAGSAFAAPLVLTRGFLDGLWQPLLNVYVNRRVGSELRATILSLQSVVARLTLAAALALLGEAVRIVGVATALGVAAVAAASLGAVLIATARPRKLA